MAGGELLEGVVPKRLPVAQWLYRGWCSFSFSAAACFICTIQT